MTKAKHSRHSKSKAMARKQFLPGDLILVDYGRSGFWPSRIIQFKNKNTRRVEYFGGTGYSGGIGEVKYWVGKAPLHLMHAYDQETKTNLDNFISKEKLNGEPLLKAAVLQINNEFSELGETNNDGLSQDKANCQCKVCYKAANAEKEAHDLEESTHTDDSSNEEEFFTPNTSLEEPDNVSNAGEDMEKLCENLEAVALNDGESGEEKRASHSEETLLEEDSDEFEKCNDFNLEESSVENPDAHSEQVLEEQANDESGVESRASVDTLQDQNNNIEKKTEDGTADILSDSESNNVSDELHKILENLQIEEKSCELRRSSRKTESELLEEESEMIRELLRKENDNGLGLKVENFPHKGRGVVSTRDFKKGEFVVEHAGELITRESANARENDYGVDTGTGCYMFYFDHQGKHFCIDETEDTGRLGRLLNHSRRHPNMVTKVMEVDGKPRLYMVAKDDIKEGTELVFDYGEKRNDILEANPWLKL